MYWFGVESRMIFMCSITSLKGAISFMRSWLVMVAGTVRMHTMALRLTSSVREVILLQRDQHVTKQQGCKHGCLVGLTWSCKGAWCRGRSPQTGSRWRRRSGQAAAWRGSQEPCLSLHPQRPRRLLQASAHCPPLLSHQVLHLPLCLERKSVGKTNNVSLSSFWSSLGFWVWSLGYWIHTVSDKDPSFISLPPYCRASPTAEVTSRDLNVYGLWHPDFRESWHIKADKLGTPHVASPAWNRHIVLPGLGSNVSITMSPMALLPMCWFSTAALSRSVFPLRVCLATRRAFSCTSSSDMPSTTDETRHKEALNVSVSVKPVIRGRQQGFLCGVSTQWQLRLQHPLSSHQGWMNLYYQDLSF